MSVPLGSQRRRKARGKGAQPRPNSIKRTYRIYVWVNAGELAELERHCALAGGRELGAYVRQAALAQRSPKAVVPELNRAAWLALAEQLTQLPELADRLEALTARARGGADPLPWVARLRGRGALEEAVTACGQELRVLSEAVQALRRSLLGSERRRP